MNIDELAKLLKNNNITVNVHNGTGDIRSGVEITQINNHHAEPSQSNLVTCSHCGITEPDSSAFNHHFSGAVTHWKCYKLTPRAGTRWDIAQRAGSQLDEQKMLDEPAEPLPIAAPVEAVPELVWVRDDVTKYANRQRPYYVPLVQTAQSVNDDTDRDMPI